MEYGYSILMFCFAVMLFLYSKLLAWTKDVNLLPRRAMIKNCSKEYVVRLAKVVSMVSIAPAVSAVVGLFTQNVFPILTSLIFSFVAFIWIGVKRFEKSE